MVTRFIINCVLISILFYSCQKDEQDCSEFVTASVLKVEGPSEAVMNEEITLQISFGCYNGCGNFGYYNITQDSDFEKTIEVVARYTGCICTMQVPVRTAAYHFMGSAPGTYNLIFTGIDTILTHQVVVN